MVIFRFARPCLPLPSPSSRPLPALPPTPTPHPTHSLPCCIPLLPHSLPCLKPPLPHLIILYSLPFPIVTAAVNMVVRVIRAERKTCTCETVLCNHTHVITPQHPCITLFPTMMPRYTEALPHHLCSADSFKWFCFEKKNNKRKLMMMGV